MDMVKIPVDAHRKRCLEIAAQMVKRYADTAPKGKYTVEKTYFALHTFYAVVSDNGEKEILCRGERTATFVAALMNLTKGRTVWSLAMSIMERNCRE